jgi:ribosomal-protein-alanine N-acetyltransferase
VELRTERLVLRRWRDADREPFAALNADPEVTRYLPTSLDRAGSDALAARADARFDDDGVGLWAVEVVGGAPFIGFVGLASQPEGFPWSPGVEVGWRLARSAWGQGFATEAARAALADGFQRAGLAEAVSMTTVENRRSRAVMERLGFTRDPADDFPHPRLAEGHPLRPHVLYRCTADRWRALQIPA